MAALIPAQIGLSFIYQGHECLVENSDKTSVGILVSGKRRRIPFGSAIKTKSGREGNISPLFDVDDGIFFKFEEDIRLVVQNILRVHDELFMPVLGQVIHDTVIQFRRGTDRTIVYQVRNGRTVYGASRLNLGSRIPGSIRSKNQIIEAIELSILIGPKGMPIDNQLSSLRRRTKAKDANWRAFDFDAPTIESLVAEGIEVPDVLRLFEHGIDQTHLEPWISNLRERHKRTSEVSKFPQMSKVWRSLHFDSTRFITILSLGLNLEQTQQLYQSKIPNQYLNSWFKLFEDFLEIMNWVASGFTRPEVARDWKDVGFQAAEAKDWYDLDFGNANEAMEWRASALSLEDSRFFRKLGIESVDKAEYWLSRTTEHKTFKKITSKFDLSLDEIDQFLGTGLELSVLLDFLQHGLKFETIKEWSALSHDFFASTSFVSWLKVGVEPSEALNYWQNGISAPLAVKIKNLGIGIDEWKGLCAQYDPELVEKLVLECASRAAVFDWVNSGLPAEIQVECAEYGCSLAAYNSWSATGVQDIESIVKWELSGIPIRLASIWLKGGVANADVAMAWRDAKFTPVDSLRLLRIGNSGPGRAADFANQFFGGNRLKTVEFLEKCDHLEIDITVVEAWYENGWEGAGFQRICDVFSTPSLLSAWRASTIPESMWCFWIPIADGNSEIAVGWSQSGYSLIQAQSLTRDLSLEVHNVAQWLKNGFSIKDCIDAHRLGISEISEWQRRLKHQAKEDQEKRRIASAFDTWINEASRSLPNISYEYRKWRGFLDGLIRENYVASEKSLLSFKIDGDWYDEVVGRVSILKDFLRKEPQWPVWYKSPDLSIGCIESNGQVLAWVGKNKRGRLAMFDSLTLAPCKALTTNDDLLVYGLAISWFLDSSLLLQGQIETISVVNGFYRPTREFDNYLRFYRSHPGRQVRACEISGHLRLLPLGWSPNESQRMLAPGYLRLRMEPQHTYVQPHSRNGFEVKRKVTEHLLRYSATAASLALIK